MFFKFRATSSTKTKFSSLTRRLGSCFSYRVVCLAAATVAAVLLHSVASATPILPAPFFGGNINAPSPSGPVVLDFNRPGDFALSSAHVGITAAPAFLNGTVDGSGSDGNRHIFFQAAIKYYFAVVGPINNLAVPVLVQFSLHAQASGSGFLTDESPENDAGGTVIFGIEGTSGDFDIREDVSSDGVSSRHESVPTIPFGMFSGISLGSVSMFISGAAIGDGIAHVSVDPFIFIDPDFLLSNPGYTVIVSDGIGNAALAGPAVPGVPEPAILALVGLGLAGMGLSRRRYLRKS